MITVYPYANLGTADFGWLKARYHFSFSRYLNPERMGFGALRVINDDRVAAGTGFSPHPHKDMEIITYVRTGAISHEDNMKNAGRTGAGDVQVMSAGTGITHSEQNREGVATTLYQIWIEPDKEGVQPRWDAKAFPKTPVQGALELLVSGRKEDEGKGALFIHQDAAIWGGRLNAGTRIAQPIKHQAYILVPQGSVSLNGTKVSQGDGAEITGMKEITLAADADAEVLVIDVPA